MIYISINKNVQFATKENTTPKEDRGISRIIDFDKPINIRGLQSLGGSFGITPRQIEDLLEKIDTQADTSTDAQANTQRREPKEIKIDTLQKKQGGEDAIGGGFTLKRIPGTRKVRISAKNEHWGVEYDEDGNRKPEAQIKKDRAEWIKKGLNPNFGPYLIKELMDTVVSDDNAETVKKETGIDLSKLNFNKLTDRKNNKEIKFQTSGGYSGDLDFDENDEDDHGELNIYIHNPNRDSAGDERLHLQKFTKNTKVPQNLDTKKAGHNSLLGNTNEMVLASMTSFSHNGRQPRPGCGSRVSTSTDKTPVGNVDVDEAKKTGEASEKRIERLSAIDTGISLGTKGVITGGLLGAIGGGALGLLSAPAIDTDNRRSKLKKLLRGALVGGTIGGISGGLAGGASGITITAISPTSAKTIDNYLTVSGVSSAKKLKETLKDLM